MVLLYIYIYIVMSGVGVAVQFCHTQLFVGHVKFGFDIGDVPGKDD